MFAFKESVDRVDELSVHEQKNMLAALHELLDTSSEAALGYAAAANSVSDYGLKTVFDSNSAERSANAAELRELLLSLGASPTSHPTFGGELHRAIIALRGTMEHGSPVALIAECERGERVALARYERALQLRLPVGVARILIEQATNVRDAHTALEKMRHPW